MYGKMSRRGTGSWIRKEAEVETRELIEVLRELGLLPEPAPSPYERWRGKQVFIRTVTYHYTGLVVDVCGDTVVLEDAAWIADSGRFADAMKSGAYAEVEPYPDGRRVQVSAIVDITESSSLPREQT